MNQPTFTSRAQSGFSLTELMIAIVLGLFLIAGILQVYLGSKRSYNTQDSMSRLQENGRFGMLFLQRSIRLAGFYATPTANPATIFTNLAPAITGTNDNANNGDLILDGTDTIVVRYQGAADGSTTNCQGGAVAAGGNNTDSFRVGTDNSLACEVNGGGGFQPLLEGVTGLQVLYGIDTTLADTNSTANRYVPVNDAAFNWANVRSVRIQLTLQGVNPETPNPVGGQVQRTFSTTIALRNRI